MTARSGKRDPESDGLIRENLRLVLKIANEFLGRGLPWDELVSEGNRGLVLAADRFDPGKGAKFSTYSTWWIKQAIRQALAGQTTTIRIPVEARRRWSRIRRMENELTATLRRSPTDEELAAACRYPLESVRRLRGERSIGAIRSFDADAEDGGLADSVADETALSPEELQIRVEDVDELLKLLATLSAREQRVLRLRFGLDGEAVKTLD
ncbi:MAG: sigma-70 family RNA polymerase sigma factor, partial [Victivallaceae bacterium]|nr:sigma-70 family RNA polymerase sigma factor [Victivallaceae bacterium]